MIKKEGKIIDTEKYKNDTKKLAERREKKDQNELEIEKIAEKKKSHQMRLEKFLKAQRQEECQATMESRQK